MEYAASAKVKSCGGEVSPRWYCRCADFHLVRPVALETGIWRFPEAQSK